MQMIAVFVMGMTSILAQTMVLRRLLTVFSGNELDIGITLSVWLVFVGAGSFAGRSMRSGRAFAASFLLTGLLLPLTVLATSLIRPAFGVGAGETVTLQITFFSTLIALAPLCVVIGVQFPLAVFSLQGNAGRVYALEASGAFLGGALFTFVLSGRVETPLLAAAISFANVLVFVALLGRKRRLLVLLIPLLLYAGAERVRENAPEQDLELVRHAESRYGELSLFASGGQTSFFSGGRFAFAYPDPQSEELTAHIPMSLVRSPAKIAVIGGSPAVAREFLKYAGVTIDFIEIDRRLIDLALGILDRGDRALLQGDRFSAIAADARIFLRTTPAAYDLIVVNLPEPATASLNRFYTVEFFREAKAALRDNGVLSLRLPASHGYIGRRLQEANGSVYHSLRSVFRFVVLTSEEYGGMFASDAALSAGPDELESRFSGRGITTSFFYPQLFRDIFDPDKVGMVAARLDRVSGMNSDRRPAAYLLNLRVWSDMLGSRVIGRIFEISPKSILLSAGGALFVATFVFRRRKHATGYALFTTGCASTSYSVILLLAYEALSGCVYEKVGLLTALFMAGAAAGAHAVREMRNPLAGLRLLDAAFVVLLAASSFLFSREAFFFVLFALAGAIGGAQFPLANAYGNASGRGGRSGFLYALDLAGAAAGALLTAVLAVPLLGIPRTLLLLALLKSSSLIPLLSLAAPSAASGSGESAGSAP